MNRIVDVFKRNLYFLNARERINESCRSLLRYSYIFFMVKTNFQRTIRSVILAIILFPESTYRKVSGSEWVYQFRGKTGNIDFENELL